MSIFLNLINQKILLGTAQVQQVYLGNTLVWANEVVATIPHGTVSPVLYSYFSPTDWANPNLGKRVIVAAGTEIGANNGSYSIALSPWAETTAGNFAGKLTLDNYGTISGIGGAPNSGVGGTVINVPYSGRNGEKFVVNNYGTIRSGGGGGGRAGNGGQGYWVNSGSEGPVFNASSPPYYSWSNEGNIYWNTYSPMVSVGSGPTAWYDGSLYTYYKGANTGFGYQISRSWSYNVFTAGGAGGNGGRGQGYDGANAGGSGGAAGGTNAGSGGIGGTGGLYGATGSTGATGNTGNYTGGLAGAAGGLAGFYLSGSANVVLNNFGTLLGRVA